MTIDVERLEPPPLPLPKPETSMMNKTQGIKLGGASVMIMQGGVGAGYFW